MKRFCLETQMLTQNFGRRMMSLYKYSNHEQPGSNYLALDILCEHLTLWRRPKHRETLKEREGEADQQ